MVMNLDVRPDETTNYALGGLGRLVRTRTVFNMAMKSSLLMLVLSSLKTVAGN